MNCEYYNVQYKHVCTGDIVPGARGMGWSRRFSIHRLWGVKQLWVQIASIPFTNPVILTMQFPLSFLVCEMGP